MIGRSHLLGKRGTWYCAPRKRGARNRVPLCILFGIAISAISAAAAQGNRVVYDARSEFQRISVVDYSNGYRRLIFDGRLDGTDPVQSEMDRSRPTYLTLPYFRQMMTALPLPAKIRRVLFVGLGGACMQRYLYRLLPEAVIESVEIDPAVLQVATDYFHLREDGRQIVHIGDGRAFVEASRDAYDIIFVDAYGAQGIPEALMETAFFRAIRDHLNEGGVACANLWHGVPDFPIIVNRYADVFPEQYLQRCDGTGNTVLVALKEKAELTVPAWVAKAKAFEKTHRTGLDLPRLIESGAESDF
jgi:spermidine synthase